MELKLNNSELKVLIDDSDFRNVNFSDWYLFHKKKNRRKSYVKSTRQFNGKQVNIHRHILGLTNSETQVDHKNGNPLDNRRENLRICTIAENNRNKTSHTNSTSKYLGVCYDKIRNKWAVCLCYNRKKVYRARFDSEIAAALAYNEQAIKYFGEFANLNKV